jgi:hypothetical protein
MKIGNDYGHELGAARKSEEESFSEVPLNI